jgi:hypothetical protein
MGQRWARLIQVSTNNGQKGGRTISVTKHLRGRERKSLTQYPVIPVDWHHRVPSSAALRMVARKHRQHLEATASLFSRRCESIAAIFACLKVCANNLYDD